MLLTELPTYMKTVLHFDLKAVRLLRFHFELPQIFECHIILFQNGLLSAVPYLAMWVLSIVFSLTADALRSRKILTTTQRPPRHAMRMRDYFKLRRSTTHLQFSALIFLENALPHLAQRKRFGWWMWTCTPILVMVEKIWYIRKMKYYKLVRIDRNR